MKRREFARNAALGLLAVHTFPVCAWTENNSISFTNNLKVPLGMCNHSLRSLKLNAHQLIQYAIEQKLDSILLNTFQPFTSLETDYLIDLGKLAKENQVSIYIGVGSISEMASAFSKEYDNAEILLKEGIRVASLVGSPIVGCRIGNIGDRFTDGGIEAHIESVIKVMKKMGPLAQDARVKFAFENHAGDLRSTELLELINETGTTICGAIYDPANALWAMEDPMEALKILGSNIICTSIRDVSVWETENGATFQCMAIGEGLINYQLYSKTMSELCPGVPLHIETISNSQIEIPYLTPEFWKGFSNLSAKNLMPFLKLVRKGKPLSIIEPVTGKELKAFDKEMQKSELLKSIRYLKETCEVGIKV